MTGVDKLWADFFDAGRDVRSDAGRRLTEHYLPIAERAAARYQAKARRGAAVEYGDHLSNAVVGLMGALPRYDPARGAKPDTFLAARVFGAIVDGLREVDELTRGGRKRGERPAVSLSGLLAPSDPYEAAARDLSLGGAMADRREPSPYDAAAEADEWRDLAGRFQAGRARVAVILYAKEGLTMREVGAALGVSESRVSQMVGRVVRATFGRREHLRGKTSDGRPRPVVARTARGEERFETATIAAEALRLDRGSIRRAAREGLDYGGRTWAYAEKEAA